MAENDERPVQGDLLKALDDLTELIAEQEHRGRVWSADEEALGDELEGFDFAPQMDEAAFGDTDSDAQSALPSPAEIEAIVEKVIDRRIEELREQVARELMTELRKKYPEL